MVTPDFSNKFLRLPTRPLVLRLTLEANRTAPPGGEEVDFSYEDNKFRIEELSLTVQPKEKRSWREPPEPACGAGGTGLPACSIAG